ncbi:hypothetical protein [Leucobacter chinensis]|uniref:hypothetical protein n=1 Tax=Leucobacter chinensis TaxID=2851010 RepID=UPI001C224672|nr:hypothetical protein [Leucobacter chinensis]
MFSIVWRFFPGPAWFRVIVLFALLAALVYALMMFIYPWVNTVIPEPESTLDDASALQRVNPLAGLRL